MKNPDEIYNQGYDACIDNKAFWENPYVGKKFNQEYFDDWNAGWRDANES